MSQKNLFLKEPRSLDKTADKSPFRKFSDIAVE